MPPSGNEPLPIGLEEIKSALFKEDFRSLFPQLKDKLDLFLQNPGCGCNIPLYNSILARVDLLEAYYQRPIKLLVTAITQEQLKSNLLVINTTHDKLEEELRKLPIGPKSISLARYQEKITAVVQILS